MNLYQKLLKVQETVGRVPKNGWNNFQKYNYVTEADLLDATRKALVEHGLALVMTGMNEETGFAPDGKRWAKIKLNYLLVNVDDPKETLFTDSVGYAEDGGDKAVYKAITGASKYLHYKLFKVSTGEDPEREEETKPAPKKQYGKPAAVETKPAPPQVRSILALMTKHQLTNEQVCQIGGIETLKGITEQQAQEALDRLDFHVKEVLGA